MFVCWLGVLVCRLVSWLDGWCAVAQSFFESRSQGMTMRFIFIATLLLAGAISVLLWRHWELTILFKETFESQVGSS